MSKDQNVIAFVPRRRRGPDPARLHEFASTARKLQQERETTGELLQRLLRETPQEEWTMLAEVEELRNSGTVDHLAKEAATRLKQDPSESLALARLAKEIAYGLPEDEYPAVVIAQLKVQACKDYARALSILSKHEEALRVLDRADAELESFGTLGHDQGIVWLQRAIVLQNLRRFDESARLIESAKAVFVEHGDEALYAKCAIAEAQLLVRRGNHRGAREVLLPILPNGDTNLLAMAHSTLGWCSIELDDAAGALTHFRQAMTYCLQLGWDIDRIRLEYGLGASLLRLAEVDKALRILQAARQKFLANHLPEEAGLCGLEMIEAHILRDEHAEARQLAVSLVQEFTDAGLNRRAIAALAHLKATLEESTVSREVVRSVSTYIVALRHDPAREFMTLN
jgi:tetratricopeptide (TPR) repeat protein